MKKIIGVIHPFDMYQTFYVYEDGNKLEIAHAKNNDICKTIFELSSAYDVYEVSLSGAKQYIKGIIKDIQKQELEKYSENKLIIKYI